MYRRTTEHAVKDFRRVPFFGVTLLGHARKVTENAKEWRKYCLINQIGAYFKTEDPEVLQESGC